MNNSHATDAADAGPAFLPHDLEAERTLLDLLLSFPARLPEVAQYLRPEHFWSSAHRRLYEVLTALEAAGAPFVPGDVALARLLVAERLRTETGQPELTATNAIPWELVGLAGTGEQVRWFAEIVFARWAERQTIQAMQTGATAAQEEGASPAQAAVLRAFDELAAAEQRLRDDEAAVVLDRLDALAATPDADLAPWRAPFGLAWLDHRTGGLVPGRVYVVSANTGTGKTWFASRAKAQLLDAGATVLDLTLEMTQTETMVRLLACRAGVPEGAVVRPRSLSPEGQARVAAAKAWLRGHVAGKRYLVRVQDRTLGAIRLRVRAVRPDAVVVDFIQHLRPDREQRGMSRYEYLTEGCETLAGMARETGREFCLLLCSQVNRAAVAAHKEDLWIMGNKDTGEIEIGADLNLLLVREHSRETPPPGTPVPLIIAVQKNRHGPDRQATTVQFDAATGAVVAQEG